MRVVCRAQERGRDVPALAVISDDRNGLPIVASQHADEAAMSFWLKQNAIADLKLDNLAIRPHLSQELEPDNDSVVQVHALCVCVLIDVDLHVDSAYPIS